MYVCTKCVKYCYAIIIFVFCSKSGDMTSFVLLIFKAFVRFKMISTIFASVPRKTESSSLNLLVCIHFSRFWQTDHFSTRILRFYACPSIGYWRSPVLRGFPSVIVSAMEVLHHWFFFSTRLFGLAVHYVAIYSAGWQCIESIKQVCFFRYPCSFVVLHNCQIPFFLLSFF